MTFSVTIFGHDDLSGDEKEKFENELVDRTREIVDDLVQHDGVNVTGATVVTNTTGSVNVLTEEIA